MPDEKVSFPYVVGTQKLKSLLSSIPDIGVPDKFTLKKLKSLGYTSSNDERFIPALKFVGLLNQSGQPTELWSQARGNLGAALAAGMQLGYFDLFEQFPNAHQKDDEALRTYFTVHSGTGKEAVTRMVQTFKAFAEMADFSSEVAPAEAVVPAKAEPKSAARTDRPAVVSLPATGPAVTINIQLTVPADPTGEIYDKFFAAMAKHLPINNG